MLISQIIETGFPNLSVLDKVSFALHLMEDYDIQHLPVSVEEKFAGIVSKDDLMDAEETATLASLQHQFINAAVFSEDHFLTALKFASHFDISLVPVINKNNEIEGIVSQKNIIRSLAMLLSVEEQGAIIVLEMDKRN
ncbi:MAG TPA: CBS domain-containing protein, partial [Panacibacter sp.]|nr:CBS domain-containing protein [Panacibacter sp.]